MKKFIAAVLICTCLLCLAACGKPIKGDRLLLTGNVKGIEVSSLPEGYSYSFSGDDAKAIVDYLSALSLDKTFSENPDTYTGMTWVIALEYESGDTLEIYHFGNTFIRTQKGSWYKMSLDEARRFETLLDDLSK